jgi:prepilin-type N-terminal cleavage/methylation domain-containing protein
MIKQKGFTLIELMIATTILMILISMVVAATQGHNQGNTISYGVNGLTEMRCIDGYKFVIGAQGQTRQVMDEFGKGVKCQ